MPLQQESLIKICRGTRRLGTGRPVLLVTSDTFDSASPFGEYYIFHEFPDMPFLYLRASCAHADSLYLYDFGLYPDIFSAKALLDSQFRAAQDRLENEVAMRDKQIANELFYSASPLGFEETGFLPLVEFAFFKQFTKERDLMFKFSKSHAVAALREKLLEYPEATLEREPKNG